MPRSLSPPSGLSMGPDKDHKLWILNTHPSRTKANSALLWPEHSWTRQMSSSRECMNMFTVLFFFYVKCSPCLQSHGVFNLHCEGLVWGDVCSMHALFFFPLQTWWLCMGYLLGSRALYSHLVFRLFPFRAIILLFFPFYFSILYTHTCFIAIANCPLVIIESSIIPLWVCAQLCQDFFLNKTVYMCEYQHQKTFASSLKAQLKYEKCIWL